MGDTLDARAAAGEDQHRIVSFADEAHGIAAIVVGAVIVAARQRRKARMEGGEVDAVLRTKSAIVAWSGPLPWAFPAKSGVSNAAGATTNTSFPGPPISRSLPGPPLSTSSPSPPSSKSLPAPPNR